MPRSSLSAEALSPVEALLHWFSERRWRWRDWRNRVVARPSFQHWAAAFPLTRGTARRHARELFDLVAGFVYSQVLLACVRLDLFELLARGPMPADRLAERCGLEQEAFDRLIDAAASLELIERRAGSAGKPPLVALGRLGAPLVGNRAVTSMIEHHATLYADLADPLALLRRQRPARMAGYWPYADYRDDFDANALPAERVAEYSALMSASLPLVAAEVLAQLRFGGHRVLLDVGGGEGTFLRAVAAREPALSLLLFDLPPVVARARVALEAAGLGERARCFGGDFFADALPAGADVVSLIRVCFDHPDDRVLTLLRNIRRALPRGGTLVLAEPMADVAGAEAMAGAYFGMYLLAMGRGRPRSAQHLTELLHAAGFDRVRRLSPHMPLHSGVLLAQCGPQDSVTGKP